jgi:hypothetical protein
VAADDERPDDDMGALEVEPAGSAASGKVSGPLASSLGELDPNELLSAIVKVKEPGYVPAAADERSRASDRLFTANVRRSDLDALAEDARVESVELSERLGLID